MTSVTSRFLADSSLFWRPDALLDEVGDWPVIGPSLCHVPFVFWMMEQFSPRQVVMIGDPDGMVSAAVCQAVKRMRLDCALHFPRSLSAQMLQLFQSYYQIKIRQSGGLADVADVDLIMVHVSERDVAQQFDWEDACSQLSPGGAFFLYGDAAATVSYTVFQSLVDGVLVPIQAAGAQPALLVVNGQAPDAVLELGTPKIRLGLEAVLKHLVRHWTLEDRVRRLGPCWPDPTTLDLPEPQTLQEARGQIAQLIEYHAADIEEVAGKLAGYWDKVAELEARHHRATQTLRDDLVLKEQIVDVLSEKLAQRIEQSVTDPEPDVSKAGISVLGLLRRLWGGDRARGR